MKNVFYFNLKAHFVLKTLKFLSCLFGHIGEQLDYKDKTKLKVFDVTTWLKNKCNTHIDLYLKKKRHPDSEIWSVNRI